MRRDSVDVHLKMHCQGWLYKWHLHCRNVFGVDVKISCLVRMVSQGSSSVIHSLNYYSTLLNRGMIPICQSRDMGIRRKPCFWQPKNPNNQWGLWLRSFRKEIIIIHIIPQLENCFFSKRMSKYLEHDFKSVLISMKFTPIFFGEDELIFGTNKFSQMGGNYPPTRISLSKNP